MGIIQNKLTNIFSSFIGDKRKGVGCTDVIVVKDKNNNFSATPFNIKFDRLDPHEKNVDKHEKRIDTKSISIDNNNDDHLEILVDKNDVNNFNNEVTLYINNKKIDIAIKIDNYGKVFFEKESDNKKCIHSTFQKMIKNIHLKNLSPTTDVKNLGDVNNKKLLETTNKLRLENYKKRAFFKFLNGPYKNFYGESKLEYNNMEEFLNSESNMNYIFDNCKNLTYYFTDDLFKVKNGTHNTNLDEFNYIDELNECERYKDYINDDNIIKEDKKYKIDVESCEKEIFINNLPCKYIKLHFSNCLDKKITEGPIDIFNKNIAHNDFHKENKCIKIEGCKNCNIKIIMTYDLFSELYFYNLNLNKNYHSNKKVYFTEFIKKKLYNIKGMKYTNNINTTKNHSNKSDRQLFYTKLLNNQNLKKLNLQNGKNIASFKFNKQVIKINIFLWNYTDKIIVSDFDGTITKSDVFGHVYNYFNLDYSQNDIAEFYSRVVRNGYKILYLSTRPMSFYVSTKKYLNNLQQNGYGMPDGPLFLSPYSTLSVIYKEVILKRPHIFKIACLKDIKKIFTTTENNLSKTQGNKIENVEISPFVAGFGNKNTDAMSYKAVNIPDRSIYLINPKGQLTIGTMRVIMTKYSTLQNYIDSVFPKQVKTIDLSSFNDYLFWK